MRPCRGDRPRTCWSVAFLVRRIDPPWDIPSRCCFFTGPWTVTRSSLCMLRRVAAFCRPLRPVLSLVSFPRSWSPVVGVLGLCWLWHDVPFARQRRPIIGVLRVCWLLPGSFDCFCCPHAPLSTGRPQPASPRFRVCETQVPCSPMGCPPPPSPCNPQKVRRGLQTFVEAAEWLVPRKAVGGRRRVPMGEAT